LTKVEDYAIVYEERSPILLAGRRFGMTLIVGMKSKECIVIGAEQEESAGVTSKRPVTKLKLISGPDWALVVGAAGDGRLAENGMRELERSLRGLQTINEQLLLDSIEEILDSLYTKYVDREANCEGVAFIVDAICGQQLHLISTDKRVPQIQESKAYAGYGGDIGIYFLDRLHCDDADWTFTATAAGFVIEQAIQACRYCSGESEIYVLQRPPNPRWRYLGTGDAPAELSTNFQFALVAEHLRRLVEVNQFTPELADGYSDEHHPEPVEGDEIRVTIPLEFFPSAWLQSPSYQKQIDEICSRNRDRLLQLGLLSNPSSPDAPASAT
jgi:20S proteasome alpha/beta subunit